MDLTPKDIESLLQPLAGQNPCGLDLEYDPAFLDLERQVRGKPEQQMGSAVVPAEEPDWGAVARSATGLLGRTKDLRIAFHLTRALLHTDGFSGLRAGLAVLRGFVEQYWDGLFPRLDPDDGNDPTFRVNALMGLCDPAVADRFRTVPLVTARTFGRFSLRDLAVASGELPPARGVEPPTSAAIDGAFAESPIADLQATAETLRQSLEHLAAIETSVGARVGMAQAPSFSKLSVLVAQAHKILAARLDRRGVVAPPLAGDSSGDATTGDASASAPVSPPGAINSREDVVRLLDRMCEYYERNEPSSPVPLLLRRCKRLVSANFLDIVRDVAPDAVSQVETLRGPEK
ncbi:MAG: type VI secretion system protein TssA [Polyangia bacterium]